MIIQMQTNAKNREVRLIKSQAPAIENNTIPVIPLIMTRCNLKFRRFYLVVTKGRYFCCQADRD